MSLRRINLLAILTSHPIQYQAPLWAAIARDGRVPFEVWFLTNHGIEVSEDREFGKAFRWDIDLLSGYPSRFLSLKESPNMSSFNGVKMTDSFKSLFRDSGITHLWVEGWRFLPMWQAIYSANSLGVNTWLRGESNDIRRNSFAKQTVKRLVLNQLFKKVDKFLCIGSANRRFYKSYGIADARLLSAPYAVDNDRFSAAASLPDSERVLLRKRWGIPKESTVILVCGKLIPKKRPMDVVFALERLCQSPKFTNRKFHLLFVGSGELENELRNALHVVYDGLSSRPLVQAAASSSIKASFAGFVNQSEIPNVYAVADLMVLPSDSGETWGLVVNEAMSTGVPCVVSDQCGCAEDLAARLSTKLVFRCGDIEGLSNAIEHSLQSSFSKQQVTTVAATHHIRHTVETASLAYSASL